ncbi:hypothetical protein AAF712_009269 [Marasmius tenuissimus]|uniref:Uncharacterized protein n=1 Tax=Marasmius tenuissimus TaxID=585030 RepID=A0ABR2ZS29_9AGAR
MDAVATSVPGLEEQQILTHIGTSVLANILSVVVETSLWVVGFIVFIWALRLQISSQKKWTTTRTVLLIVTIYLFLASTALWAMGVSWLVIGVKTYFLNVSKGVPLEVIEGIRDDSLSIFGLPMELLFLINMIVGDSVVIWRAWVICSSHRLQKLVLIPIAMLLASFAFTVIAANCLVTDGYSGGTAKAVGARTCEWGEPIAWAISLLTNFTSTSLIAVVAWRHRRLLNEGHMSARNSRSQQVLLTLVESGFIYCLVWLTQVDIFLQVPYSYTFKFFIQNFFGPFGDQISGIYAMSIIILVNKKQSISDFTSMASRSQPSTLVFATSDAGRDWKKENGSPMTTRFTGSRSEDEDSYAMRDLDLEK